MSETPLDLAAIQARADVAEKYAFDWLLTQASAEDAPDLLAEVDRLTRIVNGYDRTPAEQRAADAEAECERLRAENAGLWEQMTLAGIDAHYARMADEARTGPGAANRPSRVAADPQQTWTWEPPSQVPLLDEWGRRHEDPRPIGPPFAMPTADDAGEGQS